MQETLVSGVTGYILKLLPGLRMNTEGSHFRPREYGEVKVRVAARFGEQGIPICLD